MSEHYTGHDPYTGCALIIITGLLILSGILAFIIAGAVR